MPKNGFFPHRRRCSQRPTIPFSLHPTCGQPALCPVCPQQSARALAALKRRIIKLYTSGHLSRARCQQIFARWKWLKGV